MQTKFYWISFLVHGVGQRSDFPSEHALSAEREECHTNSRTKEKERIHQGPGGSKKYSSHSFP